VAVRPPLSTEAVSDFQSVVIVRHILRSFAHGNQTGDRAVAVSGERTKTAAVKRALEEFIARRQQGKIVDLFGTLEWDPRYDYKTARSRD
jgi:Bacterial antitoxin of type II TA system, VapB